MSCVVGRGSDEISQSTLIHLVTFEEIKRPSALPSRPALKSFWGSMGVVTPGGFEGVFAELERRGADTPESILAIQKRFGLIER
ncbi:hypothetical protein [Rhizobium sp. Root1220]|uniref:hypothetical protein n=1 Tax=Rhizobium sp. Root1220 TaxID=1736432 RepID=UPI000B1992C4|nr:hypothetical protein [Rhizobium sp. Root1220]